MDFNEKLKLTGHLEVIKIDNKTGEETVLFDDHNVITSGLGQSIAQFMTASGCYNLTPCRSTCRNEVKGQLAYSASCPLTSSVAL